MKSPKQNTLVRQFDEHRIRRFSSPHRDKPDTRPADLQLYGMVNGNIRLETADVIRVEAFAEEVFGEDPRRIEFAGQLVLVIAPGIETQVRIQRTEIRVSANMVPVGVGNEGGRQWRQAGRMRSQRFVGGLGRVRPRTGVNADRKSTRLNSSHSELSRMPSSA